MELNQDLIEEGKALVVKCDSSERMTCESRMELGRWVEKVVPQVPSGTRTDLAPVGARLEDYAEAIGVDPNTLRRYRDVAVQWGDDDYSGLTWSAVRKLAPREDKLTVVAAVFEKYGRVTEYTIQCYNTWIQSENIRRQKENQQQIIETAEDTFEEDWDEEETEVEYIYDPVQPPININQPRKHGFSGPIRKLFSVVAHVQAAKALLQEESIPSVDFENDEHFEEIMSACDTIVTEIIDYRAMVVAKRVKAGLSTKVG